MKKVVLFCVGGMSTTMLVKKMQAAAEAEGLEYDIAAHALSEMDAYGPEADIILLGPQVKYKLKDTQTRFADKPVEAIEMSDYGMMRGDRVIAYVKETLGD